MMHFTVEEENLICMYHNADRRRTIGKITAAMPGKGNYFPKKRMGFGQHGIALRGYISAHLRHQPFSLGQCSFHRVRPPLRLMDFISSLALLRLSSE